MPFVRLSPKHRTVVPAPLAALLVVQLALAPNLLTPGDSDRCAAVATGDVHSAGHLDVASADDPASCVGIVSPPVPRSWINGEVVIVELTGLLPPLMTALGLDLDGEALVEKGVIGVTATPDALFLLTTTEDGGEPSAKIGAGDAVAARIAVGEVTVAADVAATVAFAVAGRSVVGEATAARTVLQAATFAATAVVEARRVVGTAPKDSVVVVWEDASTVDGTVTGAAFVATVCN